MLSNDKSVVRYAISAAVTAYDIDFPFWDFSEIVVTATNSATGASVVLKKDVDYTITVSEAITDPVYQDGTVNMISDTYKSYNALVISRELSLTQDADYKNGEPINADTLEMSLDRATAQIQQVAEEAGHAMKLPLTEDAGDYTLPEASQRQRKVLGFDSNGKTLVMFSNPDDAIEQANEANEQSSQILEEVTTLKGQAEDAKEAAEEAQGKAEDAQAAAEQAKADTQEIADEAETTIGNSNTTGLRGEAVTAIQTALENALASIGESNSEGARGDAIEAITAALNAALASIGQTDSTGARGEALTAIATALTNALAVIGESNDAGARGSAITAISQALANALNAIGESNSAGARGDAISAIAEALDEALAAIGTSDTTGARGAAITAIQNALNTALASWESQVEADNAALDQKIAGANATIDEKVQDASDSASAALASQNAAKASEDNAKASETAAKASETNAKTSETNAKNSETASATSEENAKTSETNAASSASEALSSKNAAATSEKNAKTSETNAKASETAAKNAETAAETAQTKAEEAQAAAEAAAEQAQAAADIDIASPTKTGITKLYDSARGQNTDGAVNQKAINDELVANDTKVSGIDTRLKSAEGTISSQEGRLTTTEGKVSTLEGKMSAAENTISAHGERLTTAENDIGTLKDKMSTAEGDIDTLQSDMNTAEQNISSLTERMQNAEEAIDDVSSAIALPIPILEAHISETDGSLIIEQMNDYTGYTAPTIRYKQGSAPSETDAVASFPMTVTSMNGKLYFRAFPGTGATNKPSASAIIDIYDFKVEPPVLTWNDDTDSVSITCPTYGASIRWTDNGTDPTTQNGNVYSGPIQLTAAKTIKARGIKDGMVMSDIKSITISKVATPTFTFSKEAGTVTMACSTSGAEIHYTTDGSTPTKSSPLYSGVISVSTTTNYKIRAFKNGMIDSDIASGQALFAQIFGVELNMASSSTALTRLTPSSDPLGVVTETINTEPVPEITGTRAGSSPFDAYGQLYGAIKRRNFESNGTPGAWEGEAGFTLTDKDVMVWIPQFWYKIVNDASANKRRYYVSTGAIEGFKLHPGSGQYVAAYETSSNNQSRSGKTVQVRQTRATFRANARAKGAGWQLCDAAERNAINLLYLIEFADTNCQAKIGAGRSSASSALQTGTTDAMTYHTGRPSGTEATVGVKYRGMENLWGNVYEWTDGANFIDRVPYYSTDRDSYADDTTAGYTACGGQNPGDGYITKQRYVEALDWCISQPDAVGGSETTYFPDYHYYNAGNRILAVGGYWYDGGICGLFSWICNYPSSNSGTDYGSRLSYKDAS